MTRILDNMDREIAPEKIRKRRIYTITTVITVLLIVAIAWFSLYTSIKPNLKRTRIKVARVERGNIYSSISASGVVEAEYEQLLLSPFSGKIKEIRRTPGSKVSTGDTILVLDTALEKEKLESLEDQLKLSQNSFRQNELSVSDNQLAMDHQIEVKKMKISELETTVGEEAQLLAVGGISEEKIRNTKQQLDLARKELELAKQQNVIKTQKIAAEQEVLELTIRMKKRELDKEKQLFAAGFLTATGDGVVISINGRIGQTIPAGAELVRISDLSSFKLTGKIADSNAEKLHTDGKVVAISNNTRLEGIIGNIRPEVENGMIKFDVFLNQNNHPDLRPNLNMELQIITAEKTNGLCLPDGPFFGGEKELQVFRISGNNALRTSVKTGLSNFERVEIADGLNEGDEVIISDVSKVSHLEKISIKP